MGDSPHIKTAIEKGPNAKPVVNFGFMDWTDHLTLALAPLKPATLKQQMTAGVQSNPMAAIALAPIADGATGFSFGLTVKGGVEAEIAVGCLDSAKTEAITKSLNDLLGLGRGQYEQSKPSCRRGPWN